MYLRSAFLDRGNLTFSRKLVIFCFCGATSLVVIVRPRKSSSCTPKWHLALLSLRPAFRRHWKTARRFLINRSGVLAATPISSIYCAHWSALMTGSRFLRMKLENADRERLSPCANLRYANVLLAKLKARSLIDCWSAIWRQWYAWQQSSLQNKFFPAICCSASVNVLTGWLLFM